MTGDMYIAAGLILAVALGVMAGWAMALLRERDTEPDVPAIAAEKRAKYAEAVANLKPDDSLIYPDTDETIVREVRAAAQPVKRPTILRTHCIAVHETQYPPGVMLRGETVWTARAWTGHGEDVTTSGKDLHSALELMARSLDRIYDPEVTA